MPFEKYFEIIENKIWDDNETWSYFIPYDNKIDHNIFDRLENLFFETTNRYELGNRCLSQTDVDWLLARNPIERSSRSPKYRAIDTLLTRDKLINFIRFFENRSNTDEDVNQSWRNGNVHFDYPTYFSSSSSSSSSEDEEEDEEEEDDDDDENTSSYTSSLSEENESSDEDSEEEEEEGDDMDSRAAR